MNKGLYYCLIALLLGLVGCRQPQLDQKAEYLLPQNDKGNFILYVSNQSFAQTPVDVLIHIDGKKAVSSEFKVGNQHTWIKYCFKLAPGMHKLVAFSDKGKATIEKDFEIKDEKHWAVINYWYYPEQDGKRHFSFEVRNEPIYFE